MGSFTYDVINWGRGEGGEVAADDEVSYFSYGKYNSNIADEGGGGIQRAIFGMTSYINAHQVADLT